MDGAKEYAAERLIAPGARPSKRPSLRRSLLEIRVDILRALENGATGPTQILYRANLSWVMLQDNLRLLARSDLIGHEERGNRHRYFLTERGSSLLRSFNLIERAFSGESGGSSHSQY